MFDEDDDLAYSAHWFDAISVVAGLLCIAIAAVLAFAVAVGVRP